MHLSQRTLNLLNDRNYNEEEDEDYVPTSNKDGINNGKRNNPFSSQRNNKKKRIGAAVLSDDDDDDLNNNLFEAEEKQLEDEDLDAFLDELDNDNNNNEDNNDNNNGEDDVDAAWKELEGLEEVKYESGVAAAVAEKADKVMVKDFVEFAGQKVEIMKEVKKGSREQYDIEAKQLNTKRRSNLAAVINMLNGKKKINTVQKTRLDWEKSKAEEGDAEELTLKTKDGYLAKQAFLQNVDNRIYDKELKSKRIAQSKKKI